MKDKGPRYSFFEENDINQFEDLAFRSRPIQYSYGDKGLILTFLGNNAIVVVHSLDGSEKTSGATTKLYRQAFAVMELFANITGLDVEYSFVSSNENLKKWALDPQKGAGIFNWDEVDRIGDELIAHKTIVPLPASADVVQGKDLPGLQALQRPIA